MRLEFQHINGDLSGGRGGVGQEGVKSGGTIHGQVAH